MENMTYKATLELSSSQDPNGAMIFNYIWEPPLAEVLKEFGEGNLPPCYQMMAHILEKAVLPVIALNEQYEAEFLNEDADENPTD